MRRKLVVGAILIGCGLTCGAQAASRHTQLLIRTQSCFERRTQHPTETFVAVFTSEQAGPIDKMWVERERLSNVLGKTQSSGDADRYFKFSNRFFDALGSRSALVRITKMKGWWVRLGVPAEQRLVVYGYHSAEGDLEPQPIRTVVQPGSNNESVVTLDYTDPALCKWNGKGNPYAK